MAEENGKQPEGEQKAQFSLQRIYLKDLSFESPGAPGVFRQNWKPEVNLDLNARNQVFDEDFYEVVLTLTVTVKNEGSTAYIVEIQQAGVFLIKGLEPAALQQTLGAFCPTVLFPYAREAIDNLVNKGSFPSLMLAPVNFDALYAERQRQMAEKAKQETH